MSNSPVAETLDDKVSLEAEYIYDEASKESSTIDDVFDWLFDQVIQSSP